MEFRFHRSQDGQYYWQMVVPGNRREIGRSSEMYRNKQDAVNAADIVRTHAATAPFLDYTA
jgi:uncharacterized protein YegP (UPF0339 family)